MQPATLLAPLERIEDRLRTEIFKKRVRTLEFFKDFDPLQCGLVSETQFRRSLDLIGLQLSENEFREVADHYMSDAKKKIDYKRFSQSLDKGKQ